MSVDITLVYSLVIVVISAVFLHKAWFAPVGRVLDERAGKLEQDAAESARAMKETEERILEHKNRILSAKRQAWKRREVIRREATDARAEVIRRVREEADGTVQEGKTEVESAAANAKEHLKAESERLAAQIAVAVLGRPLSSGPS